MARAKKLNALKTQMDKKLSLQSLVDDYKEHAQCAHYTVHAKFYVIVIFNMPTI